MLRRAAFVGALVGIGIFLFSTVLEGGLRACVGDAIWDPAFDVANGPARLLASVWESPAVAPQQRGWQCVSARAHAWNAEQFAAVGGGAYAVLGAALVALGRFLVAGA